ncbi:hypothetical protein A2419_03160 [Candidatus Adlerbacteria bacterium RIFOXYC1_FULL_48_26]|uniref:IPT/TIG domain-containing protein n=1 Tax=Candidatus Adlerbacteria bacterium RIFOXYC1_FULL_48_26 TaxID=1797247 RepID=A0A1F4Y431_9BACT|nr:MAG: hypothetical protein A2419_03160 [Candidatus Adlerbacteria bacterium RIFOXYC1_FULL_48_26]OGC94511.1 MAG: hypothetical protein A2389_01320 [Candidatus Adlerbacteria bacterium RIFOXYB1_FULL_48_10]OGC94981.1 MAG: hypothetical protein A2590_02775 [Candidatus Adlerbacteria bacterium RIFOXYD1_FULL_48_8]
MQHKFFILLAVFFMSVGFAHAQTSLPDPVQYVVIPETPGPNQQVTIEVSGVGTFLGNAAITWQMDGKTVGGATGRTFTFTTGGIGSPTNIRLTINSATQGIISHNFAFNPSVINLVWEADTYTPLLYKGKALYSAGSSLRVVAFPTVLIGKTLIASNKLSFQWSRNDTPDPSSSGLGKNVFSFYGDQLNTEENVVVDVYSGGVKVGQGRITIPASKPTVIMYSVDPLRGTLLGTAFQTGFALPQTETTLKAEPYFFSNISFTRGQIKYNWSLGGEETTGPDAAKGLLTLRQTGTGSGSANISVDVQNNENDKLIQAASANLNLLFGPQTGSSILNLFGL